MRRERQEKQTNKRKHIDRCNNKRNAATEVTAKEAAARRAAGGATAKRAVARA